jgi:hypothetical protein
MYFPVNKGSMLRLFMTHRFIVHDSAKSVNKILFYLQPATPPGAPLPKKLREQPARAVSEAFPPILLFRVTLDCIGKYHRLPIIDHQ